MTNLKGIIFDFDGTLADTLPLCILSFQQAMEKITGKKYSEAEITEHFGKSEEGIIARLISDRQEEALWEYVETYKNNHYMNSEMFPGMPQILEFLKKANIKTSLITGKGQHTIRASLEYLELTKYFEYVEHGHPDKGIKAECITKIAGMWDIKSSEIAYIGDQPSDIAESKEAGAIAVAVSWAKTSDHNELMRHNPDFLFSNTNDFYEWIKMHYKITAGK